VFLGAHSNRYDHSKYPPNVVHSVHPAIQPFLYHGHNETKFADHSTNSVQYQRPPNTINKINKSAADGKIVLETKSRNASQSSMAYPASNQVLSQHQWPYGQGNPARQRNPNSLPPFMNNLMDSVANFFSNVG
jgi:hypothetical protein